MTTRAIARRIVELQNSKAPAAIDEQRELWDFGFPNTPYEVVAQIASEVEDEPEPELEYA